jgi:hypothetical protein
MLIAEPKYFDANKTCLEEKKRKAAAQLQSGKFTKAVRRTKSAPTVLVSNNPELEEVEDGEENDQNSDTRLMELYSRAPIETPSGKVKVKLTLSQRWTRSSTPQRARIFDVIASRWTCIMGTKD